MIAIILENKLESFNVPAAHINFLKHNLLEPKTLEYYYDRIDMKEYIEDVPVEKIVALGLRGRSNQTWWDHATYKVGTLIKCRMDRFEKENNLVALTASERSRLFSNDSFINHDDPVRLICYEEDQKYFVSNGNHRVTWAKLLDIPKIKAKVTKHSFNPIKYDNYILYSTTKELLELVVKSVEMEMVSEDNYVCIYFNGFFVNEYPNHRITDFSNEKLVKQRIEDLHRVTDNIRKIDRDINFYRRFPKKSRIYILKILKIFINNNSHWSLIKDMMESLDES